ncbi:hypothetical protein L3Q82_005959 [Scortum barcoo]|uniref:Uncharacterized protein n=1 Tax=Scortum barcoo TaxID=214431 RepID=A0ACB8X311_9TELE|nr:hypothetical protein L3Q82_005959 [Scortum barcoo]
MFHQFHVDEADRNYLRFLWWKKGDLNAQPSEFRMKVHLFGAASSPGCASYGLKHLAKENRHIYPQGSQFVMRDFYLDDGVTSVESTEDAIQLAREAHELCATGGLRLHKFMSNDRKINVNLKDQPATRRGVLSTVASLYDPLGFVAPILLKAKIILQETCRHGTDWDDPLSDELRPKWEQWRSDLVHLDKITISRTYAPASFGKVSKTELHHFSDASLKGYGQCSYLRLQNEEGDVHCVLIIGKSRVSPTKVTTIPRLELSAAVVSVKMSSMLKEELGFSDAEEFFWTDSKVVLGYIRNEARRFHTFVANQVQKIHLSSVPQQWSYVPTNENPADHASRGLTPCELLSSTWFTGPEFLWNKEIKLSAEEIPELTIGDPEVRHAAVLSTRTTEQVSLVDRLSKFSSWSLATRAVARLLRRISKNKSNDLTTVTERERAEHHVVKDLQRKTYREELHLLSKGNSLPSHKSIKHPAIIPKGYHITKMIIAHCHERTKHQGKGLTINEIRSNGYWIPGINRAIAFYIRQCVTCRRQRKPTEEQKMADLPLERVEPSPPFTYCGMDCFGPFITKQGRKENKREDMYGKKRWRHVQYLAEQFWSRWRKEYLANIALRQRWHKPRRNLQVGDIVILKAEDVHRNEWRMGRVSGTIAGNDGLVRRVKVCLGDKQLALLNYLRQTPKPDNPQDAHTQDVEKEQWHVSKEVTDAMRHKAKLFSDFADANRENKKIKFFTVGLTDETQKGSSIHLYKDGFSVSEDFEPPSKPETVTVSDVNHNSVTLKISPPRFGAENITSYSVEHCVSGEDGWHQQTASKAEEVTVSGLSPNTEFMFRCRALTSVGVGPANEVSGSIKTLPCSPPGKPQVELTSSEMSVSWQKPAELRQDVQILSYMVEYAQTGNGVKDEDLHWKQMMSRNEKAIISGLQSETGFAIRDNFRFKLIDEDQSRSQAESQTSEVTVYKINHQQGFKIDYSLTIVDSPGFGDTRSAEEDKEISEHLYNLFSAELGVGEVDAVCLVLQDALARLTPSQIFVFESVLSIAGRDVAENIRVLVTFADCKRPPVLEAINATGVPCPKTTDRLPVHFKFNNSALFAHNTSSAADCTSDFEAGGL